jgi:hypothetical protein
MRLSACLIARDEEETLPRCLASLTGVVDEICVLDTGSRDRTPEIARLHGAKTGFRAWDQDFSTARNASLELASGDWILQIDADEEIDPTSLDGLRRDLENGPPCRLVEVQLLDGTPNPATVQLARLFRRDERIRYSRPVHESVVDSLAHAGLPPPSPCSLRLVHHGYKPEFVARRDKHQRNLSILRSVRDKAKADAYDFYKLATTLPTWDSTGERREALESGWNAGMAQPDSVRAEWPWWDRFVQTHMQGLFRNGRLTHANAVARTVLETENAPYPLTRSACAELHLRAGLSQQALEFCRTAISALQDTRAHHLVARSDKDEAELEWIAARSAWACNLQDAFLVHVSRSISLGSLDARCLLAGWKISQGTSDGWKDLDLLLRSDSQHPSVLMAASEAAFSQGDRSTSDLLLEKASLFPSDAAQRAHCRLWARAWQSGRTPPLDQPAFDFEAAAIHGFLAVVRHHPWRPDPFFRAGAIRTALADLLESLLNAGLDEPVRLFARASLDRDSDLPGISQLVESV